MRFERSVIVMKGHLVNKNKLDSLDPEVDQLEVRCEISNGIDNKLRFRVLNGVSGYESWYLDHLLNNYKSRNGDFVVCAGTHRRYDRLLILESEWDLLVSMFKNVDHDVLMKELIKIGCGSICLLDLLHKSHVSINQFWRLSNV